ncbi:replication-relaxation family protein [Streptomyces sp. CBMA123]|uniref:replication-relaxation family protein n=1 Tax=Streptomyces sp. CBMA123 TaxID=1896313 RepID=UPI001661C439|nr:replication-relaxation family protein [Streptomyces sp. CBMA123]MBD0695828.1 hypothetical protein [Streptomyces sp. CBMA123]
MHGDLETDHDVLVTLHRFTLATAEQLHQLHGGTALIKQTQKRLTRLHADGLAEFVTLPQADQAKAWHLTAQGAAVAATFPEARRPSAQALDGEQLAVRHGREHLLDVGRIHAAFVADARTRGEGCGPLDLLPAPELPVEGGSVYRPAAELVLVSGEGGGVLGEGGVQRRACLPGLGVDDRLRQVTARAGAEDDPAVDQGHPAVQAVDVALRPAAGKSGALVESADSVVPAPAQPHRTTHQRGVEDRTAQIPVGGRGAAAARGQSQPVGRGGGIRVGAGGVGGHRAVPPEVGRPWRQVVEADAVSTGALTRVMDSAGLRNASQTKETPSDR